MVNPDTGRQWRRAWRYIAANQAAPARAELEAILLRDPADVRARIALSGVHASQDRLRAAARLVREAAAVPTGDPAQLLDLAGAALRVGEIVVARELLGRPAIAASVAPAVWVAAAGCWQLLGEHQAALAAIERAACAGASGCELHFQRAVELGCNGDLAGAESEFERCIGIGPPLGQAFVQLAQLHGHTSERNHLAAIEAALPQVAGDNTSTAALLFARYRELEDVGRHAEAWQALQRANALTRVHAAHDAAREAAVFERMLATCTPEFLYSAAATDVAGSQPIFVIGMPRSGTTLLERILGNHSQVESAGELAAFGQAMILAVDHWLPGLIPDEIVLARLPQVDWAKVARRYLAQSQWRARGKRFYVDKLPRNWMWAGLIHKALPQARILNLVRAPMDVCFSNWRACLGDGPEFAYACDLDALAAHYRQYRRVLAGWHRAMPGVILDVEYARLTREPEAVAREVFEFCGLPYEAGCTDLTRNQTPSATLSMAQVRQPIQARSSREWVPYTDELAGLAAALAAAQIPGTDGAGVAVDARRPILGLQPHG